MELPVAETGYAAMFYTITGTMVALFIAGLGFTAVAAFRFLGGRASDRELVAAHALYWYVLAAVFSAVWLIVYVTK
jgi:heme/copper-type cytochrome/quinol oxidase subunit 3